MKTFPVLLLLVGCPASPPSPEPGTTGDSAAPHTDADSDGSPADVDCDDTDPNVFPGAPDPCDGKDVDCSGLDGDPEVPEARWIPAAGNEQDLSSDLAQGVEVVLDREGALYVCGGDWTPAIRVKAPVELFASGATFHDGDGASMIEVDTEGTVAIHGGVWTGETVAPMSFKGGSTVLIDGASFDHVDIQVRESSDLTVDGVPLTSTRIFGDGGRAVRLRNLELGGDERVVDLEDTDLELTGVSLTNTSEGTALTMDGGRATITALTRHGEGGLLTFANSARIEVSDSVFTDTSRPLTFGSGTSATVRDTTFEGGGTAISAAGTLSVEDSSFIGASSESNLVITRNTTVRNSTFAGASTSSTLYTFAIWADVSSLSSELLVEDCTFTDLGHGGGAVFANGPMHITGSQFVDLQTDGVWLGDYGNLPFSAAELEGTQVIEDSQFTGTHGFSVRGWLCPTLIATTMSGSTASSDVALQSDGALDCVSFGEGATFTGGVTKSNVSIDAASASLTCTDCSFTGSTVSSAVFVDGEADILLHGGTMSGNTYFEGGVWALDGRVELDGVDLGTGVTENAGDDVALGAVTFDGSATTSITCTPAGCV